MEHGEQTNTAMILCFNLKDMFYFAFSLLSDNENCKTKSACPECDVLG